MTATHIVDVPLKHKVALVLTLLALFMGMLFFSQGSIKGILFPERAPTPSVSQPPTAALALSAYLEETGDKQRPLMIVGWVEGSKTSEPEGKVKLTLRRLKKDFRQTQLLPVKQGKFEAPYVLGFTAIDQDEPIHIAAEALVPDSSGHFKHLTEEIYLNARSPLFSKAAFYPLLLTVSVILLGIFLWAFTGKGSPLKNRMAIIFSYVIIMVFLALPLLAPVILPMTFPEALEAMKRTPVGLVVTKATPEPDALTQWALNIGGHVPKSANQSDSDVVEVQGGLIIPLYVIILSVIGGAINMTRQVPKFQEESEAQEDGLIKTAVGKLLKSLPVAANTSPSATSLYAASQDMYGAESSDGPSSTNVIDKGQGATSTKSIRWRTGLLNQYMFLISAPFLAIATYYMLIGLSLTKVPVMVLVAFSVGLISEPILRTITDTAARFLRQQPPADSPAPARRNVGSSDAAGLIA